MPGHVHLDRAGAIVKRAIEQTGCFAAEFNTIAIDDGIAMGHDCNILFVGLPAWQYALKKKRANILLVQNLALVNSSPVGSRTLIDGTGIHYSIH